MIKDTIFTGYRVSAGFIKVNLVFEWNLHSLHIHHEVSTGNLTPCDLVSPLAGGVSSAAAERNSDDAAGKRHIESVMLLVQLQTQHPALTTAPATRCSGLHQYDKETKSC